MPMFVTFYSFKGGVGRTLALANVATLLARDQGDPCRVLAWDFDLGAPGLQQVLGCSWSKSKEGFVDYVVDYLQHARINDIKNYIHATNVQGLDILPAGYLDRAYGKKLEQLRWRDIYRQARGFNFMEAIKRQIASLVPAYDYVLIDSLTGYSDVGGICVKQLPDAVVLVFRLNHQNIGGISRIHTSIKKSERPVQVLPVISPSWPFAAPDANIWMKRAQKIFPTTKVLEISFEGGLTFGEKVIARDKRPYAITSRVLDDYKRLTSRLRALNPQDLRTIFKGLDELISGKEPEYAAVACLGLVIRRPNKQEYWQKLLQIIFILTMNTSRPQPTQHVEEARKIIDQACADNNPFALMVRGQLRERTETPESAFPDFTRAIEVAPKIREPYLLRAVNSIRRHEFSLAVADLSTFIELGPQSTALVAAYGHRAECYMSLGKPESAIRDLSEALAIQPRNVMFFRQRARARYMADQYADALKDLNQAGQMSQEFDELDKILKAHILFASGQTGSGLAILDELQMAARHPSDFLNLAEAFLVADPSKALQVLQGISEPGDDAAPLAALRAIAFILLDGKGGEVDDQEKLAVHTVKTSKPTKWSWFELRQFLRWGPASKGLDEEKKRRIERLISELGSEEPVGTLAWSASLQPRLDRLRLQAQSANLGAQIPK